MCQTGDWIKTEIKHKKWNDMIFILFFIKDTFLFFNNCEWQLQIGLISVRLGWSLISRTLKQNVNFRPIKQTRHWSKHERKCLNLPTYFHPPLPDSRLLLKSPSNDLKLEIYPQDQLFRKKRILAPFVMPMMQVEVKVTKHSTPNFFRIWNCRTRAFFFYSV